MLADRHSGVTEGIRGLLATRFEIVVTVADQASLLESAVKLDPVLAVVELTLARGERLAWLSRLRAACPTTKVIVLSVYDEPSVRDEVLAAGADGFLVKRDIASRLMTEVDAVLEEREGPEKEAR